ncbi:MAG: glycosyltransferase family 2 protein [Chloroflexota bacterium]
MLLSVVIPVYNEVENLPLLHRALHDALDGLPHPWEAILVDDGSSDGSVAVLERLAAEDPASVRVVEFRRNFGQTAAIAAGIDHAAGDVIVLMDADLQNDPRDIPAMLAKLDEGYDVVSGWRYQRQDKLSRRLPSRIANGLIARVTGVDLHDYGCTLKAYRREVITGFRLYGEMHRFIPVYARMVGANIVEVKVNHHPRIFGKAKYGLGRTLKVVLDLLTVKFLLSYAAKPIYLFGGVGFGLMGLGSFALLYALVDKLLLSGLHLNRNPLLSLSVMLFSLGFQSILMGLLAEMMARTYHESQDKRTYIVKKTRNIESCLPVRLR